MHKVRKNVSIEKITEKIIKEIAKKDKRTESSVIDLAVQAYAAQLLAVDNLVKHG